MHILFTFVIVSLTEVLTVTGEYGDRIKNATVTWGDSLEMEESRHRLAVAPYPAPDPRNELPVTFQAPYVNARDYWNDPARRTGAGYDHPYLTQPFSDGFNTLYGFMHRFFGTEPPPPPAPYRRPSLDFPQQPPTNQFYIPGPKPLRASIQKLEPPRSPFSIYQQPQDNYPQFVSSFVNDVTEGRPEPVLEKPDYIYEYIVPTTYKPKSVHRKRYRTTTTRPFPVSIQDKLPPVKQGEDTRIPYVIDTTTYEPTLSSGTKFVFPPQTEMVPQLDYAIDIRNSFKSAMSQPIAPERSSLPSAESEKPQSTPIALPNILNENSQVSTEKTIPEFEITTNGETGVQKMQTTTPRLPINPKKIATDEGTHAPETTTPILGIITTIVPDIKTSTTQSQKITSATVAFSPVTSLLETPTESLDTTTVSMLSETTKNEVIQNADTTTEMIILKTDPSEIIPVATELPNTMEPLESSSFKGPFAKQLNPHVATTDSTTSADYITDLTVRGLKNTNAVHASVPRYLNTPNVTSIIGYVINATNATVPPEVDSIEDAWSLDAKILKDTNWDGFQPIIPTTEPIPQTTSNAITTTTELIMATTLNNIIQFEENSEKNLSIATADLNEIITSTDSNYETSIPSLPTTTPSFLTTLSSSSLPLMTITMTTTEPTETRTSSPTVTLPVQKEVVIATRMTKSVSSSKSGLMNPEDAYPSPRNNDVDLDEVDVPITTTRRSRKYQRRQRVKSFTPRSSDPTSTEGTPVKLGTLSRPFVPKRSRVNATLTFSSRAGKRRDDLTSQQSPSLARTREENAKVRNLYKRRNYPSQLRRSSTEESPSAEIVVPS